MSLGFPIDQIRVSHGCGGLMGEINLLEKIIKLTNLPEEPIRKELLRIIKDSGKEENLLDIEEVRFLIATYLQEVILEAREQYS